MDAITFTYSYLKKRKLGVKINHTASLFKIVLSGVLQGSILGPIFFDIPTNGLLLKSINETKVANFADDNTIYAVRKDFNELLSLLEKKSEVAIKRFSDRNMIANPEKSQTINSLSNHN